jgi:5-methylcytosine-specific restriction endonuclease McrA
MPDLPKTFKLTSIGQKPKQAQYTYDYAWTKLRNKRIAAEPLCRLCMEAGHVTPATQVDHIKPRAEGGRDEWDNTQSLCLPCHQAKTAEENRRGIKARKDAGY